ncbi:MAG: hypothetical protein CVT88_06215 [Candidatus Altiarchaeales archaeon HGW-Altiarchaeales-1]|nr:MAG: hypothetical protein CVT88_06215 [Candidatus Altiarchaeales archaeon HGW-Altiarchaeales-1]PKP59788.1 MAG: hypothetical protein CVT89_00830 [Candidatus Altiarchaeales archaeon HGW-Altiarchaeales-2]
MGIFDKLFGKKKTEKVESETRPEVKQVNERGTDHDEARKQFLQDAKSRDLRAFRVWGPDQKIEISGDWMTLFWSQRPIEVYAHPDRVIAFLNQNMLPYLWPDDMKYKDSVNSEEKPQNCLRLQWIVSYLHHPDSEVIIKTLQTKIPTDILETVGMTDALGDLLIHSDTKVRNEAAKVAWRCSDALFEGLFKILSSQGMMPSGISPREGKQAVEILGNHCPPERRQLFQKLVLDAFGPTVAKTKQKLTSESIKDIRKVCGKCGITMEERIRWWHAPKPQGVVRIGCDDRELFLYCNHCQKRICGGCSIDLGMTAGCPFCMKELVYMDGTSQ